MSDKSRDNLDAICFNCLRAGRWHGVGSYEDCCYSEYGKQTGTYFQKIPDISPGKIEVPVRDLFKVEVLAMLYRINGKINKLRKEVSKLANNDAALTQVVTDLVSAFTDNTNAIQAEIAALKSATTPGDDPVVDAAIANLQTIVTNIKASTAAAQAAIAPPPAAVDQADGAGASTEGNTQDQ